jgi:hypothetical protein
MAESLPSPRCCESHGSWSDLVQHLIEHFPDVDPGEVVDILYRARRAAAQFGLPEDERMPTAEVIARNQLLQLTDQSPPSPRLDPESHRRHQPSAPESV